MKTKKIYFMLLAWTLTGAMVFAQNSGAQKGDVNRDGAINESDVPAIIKIMSDEGGVGQSANAITAGDLNNDGVVDVADLNALLKIIDNQGSTTEPIYYWYVGQTDPSTMTEISPIVSDNSSPGWRLIGNNLPNYSAANKLWDGSRIETGASKLTNYVALPNNTLFMYDSLGNISSSSWTLVGTKEINHVTYTIYSSVANLKAFTFNIY